MDTKNKKKKIDFGQLIGGIIFLCLFLGLVWLGIFYDSDADFTNSFFEDVSEVMKWQSE